MEVVQQVVLGRASQDRCLFFPPSSSVVHVPGVNDIQSSSSAGQNLPQMSRQLNQSQVAWTGSRPPFPGQVPASLRALPHRWESRAGHTVCLVLAATWGCARRSSSQGSSRHSRCQGPITRSLGTQVTVA